MSTIIDFEPNNTRQTAEDIRFLERELLIDGLVITNDDWYEIEVDSGSNSFLSAALFFSHSQGDLDFELLDSFGTVLERGSSINDNEFVQASGLSNGIYYLRVYGFSYPISGGGAEYSLQWDDFSTSNQNFDFENNETRQTAEDISFREGDLLTGGIIVSNEDWFEIEVDSGFNSTLSASIFFDHDRGDLDLQLLDGFGNEIDSSLSISDNETVEASGLSNGTYYLRVYSAEGQLLGNEYDLRWDDFNNTPNPTPNPTPDPTPDISGFDTQYYRFQNTDVPGTYIFVDEVERQNILVNFKSFVEEGPAFKVRLQPGGDDLIAINRYQSTRTPGTYLFTTADEFQNDPLINQNDFYLEGQAFYAYRANSGNGTNFYRFENTDRPGTYLFPGPSERENILVNFTSFEDQGMVWAVET